MRRDLLILACPTSGTKYTSEYLHALGADIGHETLGRNGAIGWQYVADKPYNPRRVQRDGVDWAAALHQVRHPLNVIASMATHEPAMLDWMARECGGLPDGSLIRRMLIWVMWNERAEKLASNFYRVEDLWPHGPAETMLRSYLELSHKTPRQLPFRSENSRIHETLTWNDLDNTDRRTCQYIYKMSLKYGYGA